MVGAVHAVRDASATCELLVVHLGAKGGPARVASLPVELGGRPTGLAAGPRGVVVVLERRRLTVLDAADPARPRVLARLEVASLGRGGPGAGAGEGQRQRRGQRDRRGALEGGEHPADQVLPLEQRGDQHSGDMEQRYLLSSSAAPS